MVDAKYHLPQAIRFSHGKGIPGSVLLAAAMLFPTATAARPTDELAGLINEYRNEPQSCEGKPAKPAGPLAPDAALEEVRIESGAQLQRALKEAGYRASDAQAVVVQGPSTAKTAMDAISRRYCSALLNPKYTAIGIVRNVDTWQIILARPLISGELGGWQEAGKNVLKLVNAARDAPKTCGDQKFSAAPPLEWNAKLAATALMHSRDMASRNYFSHEARDGSRVDDRAERKGYRWRRIGENIAAGQGSAKQVVSGWMASPSHCANIMNRHFTEMGAAFAVNEKSDVAIYWTQVFGTPR